MRTPKIGDSVLYTVNAQDVQLINDANQAVGGNNPTEGDQFPAVIVRVWGDYPGGACNLQVFVDGRAGTHWASSRLEGTGPGSFSYPTE